MTFAAHREIQINQHNNRAWLAWHIAALSRTKKVTPLRSLLMQHKTPRAHMDEQIAGLVTWVRATGGKVIYKHG